jgi:hypothetical protein
MWMLLTSAALAGGPNCDQGSCADRASECRAHHARWMVVGVGLVGSSWSVLAPAIAEVNGGDEGDPALRVSGLLGAGVGAVSIGLMVAKSAQPPPAPSHCAAGSAPPPPPAATWQVETEPVPEVQVDDVWTVEPVDQPVDPWVIEDEDSDEPGPWGPL